MKKCSIAVIGTGGIGSRHLQSLAGMERPVRLYAVDTNPDALKKAQEIVQSVSRERMLDIAYLSDISMLPKTLDAVIVATSSLPRRAIIEKLLDRCEVRNLILEKFLFTCEADYKIIGELLQQTNTPTWVNCPMRMFSGYIRIKEEIRADNGLLVAAMGGNYGIACNGIHYTDLAAYLQNDRENFEFYTELLYDETVKSKRYGCLDFAGTLVGATPSGAQIVLAAQPQSDAAPMIYIATEKRRYVIEENAQCAKYASEENDWVWEAREFPVPYQSQMTAGVITQLLDTGDCLLPKYEQSARVHLPLLHALLKQYRQITGKEEQECPIT